MAVRDLEAFLRQIAREWDPSLDVSEGSPFDTKIVQRVLRRLGTDPFTVDMATFVQARLKQAYPDVAFDEGGALTDLLIKPVTLLWDPIVRESVRIQGSQSFKYPGALTTEEAEALGANLFSTRETGEYAKGVGRILFDQPQVVSMTPEKFFTSKGGLHFFPIESQSIRAEEMILNVDDDGLYYFDVNLIAENPGSAYNIGPRSLVSVANTPSAVGVTNLRRFQDGLKEETATDYVYRAQSELTERSLVSLRGIAAKITRSYPEVQRLNVVGFNDPEMQRDIVTGGSFGDIIASGTTGRPVSDGEGANRTRRFYTTDVDLTTVASAGPVSGLYITIFGASGSFTTGRDFEVESIVSPTEIDVTEQEMFYSATGPCAWAIRRKELTLSGIPGGILYPDSPYGTVTIEPDEIHIGGTYDVYLRATELESTSLVLTEVIDDEPAVSGLSAAEVAPNQVTLTDIVLNATYFEGDSVYTAIEEAGARGYTLQIETGTNAGSYRVLSVTQTVGLSPVLYLTPDLPNPTSGPSRWRLVDELTIELTGPRHTKVSGNDLSKIQGSVYVTTSSGTDFDALGVAEGDVVQILEGQDAGEYTLTADPIAPGFTSLELDAEMTFTETGVSYTVYTPNVAGSIDLPLVRVTSVELLDSGNQPQGTTVPYAKPVDIQSRSFQNPARGVKHDWVDVSLGLVSGSITFPLVGTLFVYNFYFSTVVVTFSGEADIASVVNTLNTMLLPFSSGPVAVELDSTHFGIRPFGNGGRVAITGGTAMTAVFGDTDVRTSCDIRSSNASAGWDSLDPDVDLATGLDVIQVLDGNQVGFYPIPYVVDWTSPLGTADPSKALILAEDTPTLSNATALSPELNVHVQIGARSIGSARMYFLEPTTIEVDSDTYFTASTAYGDVRYLPDPSLSTQLIPPLPGDVPVRDGETTTGSPTLTSLSQDFNLSRVHAGDDLLLLYWPLAGTVVMPSGVPVANASGTTLTYSVDNGPWKTVTFVRDDPALAPTDVSREGIVSQINASFGDDVCSLTGTDTLEFEADMLITISETGTANELILGDIAGTAPPLSFHTAGPNPTGNSVQRSNRSPSYGTYRILSTATTTLQADAPIPIDANFTANYPGPSYPRQSYQILRPGAQRITTTDMGDNEAEAGLYYFDVELVSEGTGDIWNLAADVQMSAEGYRSEGWYLTTEDSNLSFSGVETVKIIVSRTILPDGVDDDPSNAIQITGQNLQVSYDRAPVVDSVQSYISSDIERVVCSSPLARYLSPYFVRMDVTYTGGSKVDVVQPELEDYITKLYPEDTLSSSNVQKIFLDRGATDIDNPLDLIAIVHEADRTVTARRSQDAIGTDSRLCTFIPDVLNIVRDVS